MRKYLLPKEGTFYKANLHCHTNISDGKKTPEEIKELYKKMGYSIVAYTDHDVLIPHQDLTDEEFLALNGFEVEINEPKETIWPWIKTCHLCFIGLEPDNITQPCWHRTKYLAGGSLNWREKVKFDENEPDFIRNYDRECVNEMIRISREKGFFVTYNHPTWSKETYVEYSGYYGMNAFEMFNGGCITEGYEDYNPRVYDDLLSMGKKIYCIGADDNHNWKPEDSRYFDSGWAWTMIKAPTLDYREITRAMEKGDFYASEGPEIHELWVEDGRVHIECSPADRIFMTCGARHADIKFAENGKLITETEFEIRPECGYFRLTVVDEKGKHACTNAYFPGDL